MLLSLINNLHKVNTEVRNNIWKEKKIEDRTKRQSDGDNWLWIYGKSFCKRL